MSFLSELKRRNVIRVGVAYLVGAWLLLQITDVLMSVLGLPDFTGKLVFALLLIGLVPALVFAWAYQVTPEGLRRDTGGAPSLETARNLDRATIAMLVLVAGLVLVDRFAPRETGEGTDEMLDQVSAPSSMVESTDISPVSEEQGSETMSTGPADQAADSPPTIAVLPFVNMSDEAGNEYFADGLSEELLNLLVKVPELRVAARTSSFSFRDKDMTVAEIARELQVGNILEGSVRKAGDRVRITAQLIEARQGFHLWSETYDRELVDIFAVQDEIASAVVNALKLQLLPHPTEHRETRPEVYTLFLQALFELNKATTEGLSEAVSKVHEALEIEPGYPPALALQATIYLFQANNGERPFDEGFEEARQSAREVIGIDPTLANSWGTLSYIESYYDWDFEEASRSAAEMRRLEPNSAYALNTQANLLNMLGRRDEAIELRDRAIRLDPLNVRFQLSQLLVLLSAGEYDRVEAMARGLLVTQGTNPYIDWTLVKSRLLQGDLDGAAQLAETLTPARLRAQCILAALRHSQGQADAAAAIVAEMDDRPDDGESQYYLAQYHAWSGHHDLAFRYLTRAIDLRYRVLSYVLGEPFFYPLYDDPRWREQIERVGLLPYWLEMQERQGGNIH